MTSTPRPRRTNKSKTAHKTRKAAPASPFTKAAFAVLWTATLISLIGSWLHEVAAGWVMTVLNPEPFMVALVQAATTVPVFLLALPAGALADIIDRRKLLIWISLLMSINACLLAVIIQTGVITPGLLLAFTLTNGVGFAFANPIWQAIVPQLVTREMMPDAITLNSVAINISRAIGPAIGGVLIAWVSLSAPFYVNAVTFFAIIAGLIWWRPPKQRHSTLPSERMLSGMRAGVRFAVQSSGLRAALARSAGYFLYASAYWALLPLIARNNLAGGPELYGILVACLGAGAVVAVPFVSRARRKLGIDPIVDWGMLASAVVLAGFALVTEPWMAAIVCLFAGAAWMTVLSTLNVAAQFALPEWVRARGISVFLVVVFGGIALGSIIWGQVANHVGISTALLIAAGVGLIAMALTKRWRLDAVADIDFTPSMWPLPMTAGEIEGERGPVMITVDYRIDPPNAADFVAALEELSHVRKRDGAFAWGLFEDVAKPGRYLEYFMVESWLDHLRQHERVTRTDRALQARVAAFHKGRRKPKVEHFLAPPPHIDI